MTLVCQSFNQGWLLAVVSIKQRRKQQGYIIRTSDVDMVDKAYGISKSLGFTTWILSGYRKEVYEIHIKGRKEDINYLLLNRKDNKEFIKGYICGCFEIQGRVIFTRGWNKVNHKEYYLQISTIKEEVLDRLKDYLNRELDIESSIISNNPQSITRLRIYKKESIQALANLLIFTGIFGRRLELLLKELN